MRAGKAIVAWRAGDPVPEDVTQLFRYAGDILSTASQLTDQPFIDRARVLLARAQKLVEQFR